MQNGVCFHAVQCTYRPGSEPVLGFNRLLKGPPEAALKAIHSPQGTVKSQDRALQRLVEEVKGMFEVG